MLKGTSDTEVKSTAPLYYAASRGSRSADSGTHRERKIRVAGRGVRRDEGSEEAFLGSVARSVNEATQR